MTLHNGSSVSIYLFNCLESWFILQPQIGFSQNYVKCTLKTETCKQACNSAENTWAIILALMFLFTDQLSLRKTKKTELAHCCILLDWIVMHQVQINKKQVLWVCCGNNFNWLFYWKINQKSYSNTQYQHKRVNCGTLCWSFIVYRVSSTPQTDKWDSW